MRNVNYLSGMIHTENIDIDAKVIYAIATKCIDC